MRFASPAGPAAVFLAALMALVLSGCSLMRSSERTLVDLTYPPSAESELGLSFAKEIEKEYQVVSDPLGDAWLQRVGPKLVEYSPSTQQQFQFHLVNSPEVNAFAIPGGFCYVNIGLILYSDNEAQVIAVVGHEINHVTRRHGMSQLWRQNKAQSAVDFVKAQVSSSAAQQAAEAAAKAGGYLSIRHFGRSDENDADEYGIKAMYGAGWDPREGIRFFEKLNELQGGGTPSMLSTLLSTHPATPDRVEHVRELVGKMDLSKPLVVDSPEFQAMKAHLKQAFPQSSATP